MKEYKIIETSRSVPVTENTLNGLSEDGWCVCGVTEYQVFLERERVIKDEDVSNDEKELLLD